jgi:hypothetical protein
MADAIPEGLLVVDHRENEKVIHKLFMRLGDAKNDPEGKVWVCGLKTGDYIIGDWIIEAKEINDLAGSILGTGRSNTVAAQLKKMVKANEEKLNWLVVYGETDGLKPWVHRRMGKKRKQNMKQDKVLAKIRQKENIRTFKRSFCLRFPEVRYFQLENMDDFVDWIVEQYTQKVLMNHSS